MWKKKLLSVWSRSARSGELCCIGWNQLAGHACAGAIRAGGGDRRSRHGNLDAHCADLGAGYANGRCSAGRTRSFRGQIDTGARARNYSELQTLMGEEFMVVFWLSGGQPYSPRASC